MTLDGIQMTPDYITELNAFSTDGTGSTKNPMTQNS